MNNDYLKDVGRFVVMKRGEMGGMTQSDCSVSCGIGRSSLSDIENGNRLPNGRELLDLSRVLNTNPNDILTAGKCDNSDFKKNKLEQDVPDALEMLSKTLFSFAHLSRDNKNLIQKLMLSMVFGDLTPKEQSEFFSSYDLIPEKTIELKAVVSAIGEMGINTLNPVTKEPFLSKNLLETLDEAAKSFYYSSDVSGFLGMLVTIAPSLILSDIEKPKNN